MLPVPPLPPPPPPQLPLAGRLVSAPSRPKAAIPASTHTTLCGGQALPTRASATTIASCILACGEEVLDLAARTTQQVIAATQQFCRLNKRNQRRHQRAATLQGTIRAGHLQAGQQKSDMNGLCGYFCTGFLHSTPIPAPSSYTNMCSSHTGSPQAGSRDHTLGDRCASYF